jgi:hypothetical protein
MSKTILIPIDFRVASLNTLKLALDDCKGEKIRAILLYCEYLNDSITELLFYSSDNVVFSKLTLEFTEALEILKNRNEATLLKVEIKILNGNGNSYFRNFLDANNVQEIFIPGSYKLHIDKNGFDPTSLMINSGYPVSEMKWNINTYNTEQEQLTALFN